VPDHPRLLGHLAAVAPAIAAQMPGNFDAPSHALLRQTAERGPWAAKLRDGWRPNSVLAPREYVERLAGLGYDVDAWETTYQHVLRGEGAVLEWVKGTALPPVLALLDEAERREFLAAYGARLRDAYPPRPEGTLFPFRRIFFVAIRR
jgi:trans-aconitate 2-methyltransferase